MATMSTNLTAGEAIAGQAGNGKGHKGRAAGLVATAALGVALLTSMVLSQARQEAQSAAGPAAAIAQTGGAGRQLFLEQNLLLPSGGLPGTAATSDQFRYAEQNLVLPVGAPVLAVATGERQRFLEQNTQLPIAGTPSFAPDQFTYREDRRAGAGTLDWEQAERAQIAPSLSVVTLDWEQVERTQVAP